MSVKIPALYFDAHGCGPAHVALRIRPMAAVVEKGEVIAARSIGLMADAHGDFGAITGALTGHRSGGGYNINEAGVVALRDALTAWLNAPQPEARVPRSCAHCEADLTGLDGKALGQHLATCGGGV